jgi:hypothetical protein
VVRSGLECHLLAGPISPIYTILTHVNAIGGICGIGYIPDMANENEIYPVKKLLRMTDEMAARISKRRYDSRLPSESETIRRLLTLGLDTLDRQRQESDKDGSQ